MCLSVVFCMHFARHFYDFCIFIYTFFHNILFDLKPIFYNINYNAYLAAVFSISEYYFTCILCRLTNYADESEFSYF